MIDTADAVRIVRHDVHMLAVHVAPDLFGNRFAAFGVVMNTAVQTGTELT